MQSYALSFVSLFVAMDVIGTLPIFVSLTEGATVAERRKVVLQAVLTAGIVAVAFMFFGKWLFGVLGITISDFRVAGGLLLLVFAIQDLLFETGQRRQANVALGVVPIGIPLIVGPAVLTGVLVSTTQHGYLPTLAALAVNLVIAAAVFLLSGRILKVLGAGGAKGIGKVASLLLAAIAVMLIRSGIQQMILGAQ